MVFRWQKLNTVAVQLRQMLTKCSKTKEAYEVLHAI